MAVLLILVGALGATVVVLRAGNKVSVVEIAEPVASGDRIPESALREVMISENTGLDFITWAQRGDLTSHYRAATDLTQGSVLVTSMITDQDNSLPAGKSLVGLSLKEGHYPQGLKEGDTVAAYFVGDASGRSSGSSAAADPLISGSLVVKAISGGGSSDGADGSGDTAVTVIADTSVAGALAVAASGDGVTLVIVPNGKH
ncbi:hypothetical protein V2S66_26180 [Streptomyces sp. V4-01]|uniref:SAF domain-containing protein n=1 Tax=Actinacidiphila polyblastidii TaxID=3110430 RepID=A0ABU7PHZ2_9ACTN|nr:hypothetical protein [Streptomyces sp. V4-01]